MGPLCQRWRLLHSSPPLRHYIFPHHRRHPWGSDATIHPKLSASTRHNRWKKKVPIPRRDKPKPMEKILDKIYWKAEQLNEVCKAHDQFGKNRVSHVKFRQALEQMGMKFSNDEFNQVIQFADSQHTGSVMYKEFAKAVKRLEGVDYGQPKRLGEDVGAPIMDANLGQGLQMLVGPPQRGKRIWGCAQQLFYNPLSGSGEQDKRSSSAFPPREALCLSFAEQAAALSEKQHQLNFASLMPTEIHFPKVPPVPNLETLLRKKSDQFTAVSNQVVEEGPTVEKPNESAEMPKLQPSQGEIDIVGTVLKHKPLPPSRGKLTGDVRKEESQPLRPRYTYYGTITGNEPLLRQVKLRKVSRQSVKDKIKHEQHYADVQAVQILG